ncbi:hypothetical protein Bbelb_296410, partial [Branchiostoma belcheri]
SGILSPDPEENPYWWNANTVYVPYCSSDVWSGASPRRDKDDFAFMGALILQEVLRELLPLGLQNSKTLLLSGSRERERDVHTEMYTQTFTERVCKREKKNVGSRNKHDRAAINSGGCSDSSVGFREFLANSAEPDRAEKTRTFLGFLASIRLREAAGKRRNWPNTGITCQESWSARDAGGTGVILNVDRAAELLRREGSTVQVQGVADSGWFLDNKQYMPTECTETLSCAPTEAIRRGIQWWNGQVPERCARQYSKDEQWRCFFGYRAYPTLQAPLFVIQWLFDEAQMMVNNVGTPVDKEQWNYIHNLGVDLRKTLANVTGVFAPACLAHTLITKSDWMTVRMKGVSLPSALHCWEHSYAGGERGKDRRREGKDLGSGDPVERTGRREGRRGRRRNRRNRRNRKQRSLLWGRAEPQDSPTCDSQLVDSCPWPHCNPTCPKLHNPFTGEEMDFIPLMMELVGIDMNAIAEQMGMDPDELVRMLTS